MTSNKIDNTAEFDLAASSSDEDSYMEMPDNDEDTSNNELTKCLFCTNVFPKIDSAIQHLDTQHKVNLAQLQQKYQMDQYSFLKLINYIRREKLSAEQLLQAKQMLWNDDKYLKPLEYETWLCYDYETLKADEPMTVSELQQSVADQSKLLQHANEVIQRMRKDYLELLQQLHDGEGKDNKPHENSGKLRNNPATDNLYFKSYDHFGIHLEMLSDTVRTTSYRKALLANTEFVRGKTVLDVGCGTGILSIFASQAGAARIVGIDNSDIAYTAMDIVRTNNVENVQLIKGRLEDTPLPEQKYDIIISEWMGYFLLYEGMLDSIIYARENHLKPGGIILPSRCTLSILGYGDDKLYAEQVEFWSDVYGVKMHELRKRSIMEPLVEVVDPAFMLTEPEEIANFDIMTVDMNYSDFTYDFKLKCTASGKLSAIVGYFDTLFELPNPVSFSTSPTDKRTHWKQTVFFLQEPQVVQQGEVVSGKIMSRRLLSDVRGLYIGLEIFGQRYKYTMD